VPTKAAWQRQQQQQSNSNSNGKSAAEDLVEEMEERCDSALQQQHFSSVTPRVE